MKRLLLVGGGHAHVEVLRRFSLAPMEGVEVVLVSPSHHTAYSGMLPGLIAGHYSRGDTHIDLERLAQAARVRFVQDYAIALDAACRTVACAQGTHVSYDVLSLDIGSVPNNGSIEDAERVGFPVKPVDRLLAGVEAVVATARSGHVDIAIVGAGAGGVELCLALDYRVRREAGAARFFLLTASSSVLPGYSERVRRRVMHVLRQRGITVRVGRHVVAAYDHGVVLDDGERIAANPVIWVTGPAPAAWLRDCGLGLDAEGFVLVNDRLQSTSHADVFAAGDVATMVDHPRPKSGVYAVRQGPPLAANLRAALRGAPLMLFQPQRHALQLITTGERYAIAAWGELAFEGRWVWRWKDWIDRRFVARY